MSSGNKSSRAKRNRREKMFAAQRGLCYLCQCQMKLRMPNGWPDRTQPPRDYATFDHVEARGLGGTNTKDNLRLACWTCNNRKARVEAEESARRRGHREAAIAAGHIPPDL